jgi:hypothetical protein
MAVSSILSGVPPDGIGASSSPSGIRTNFCTDTSEPPESEKVIRSTLSTDVAIKTCETRDGLSPPLILSRHGAKSGTGESGRSVGVGAL